MRKFVKAAGLGVLVGLSLAAVAGDANNGAETRAYFNFGFGGARDLATDWHAGLQLSPEGATRAGELVPASTMKIDFSNRGNALMLNGMPLVQKSYRLQQAEGEAAEAAAEEGGFFSGIGDFFSNLFGGDDEEAAAEGETAAVEGGEAVAEEPGMFSEYTAGDWALLGVGVIGAGYLIGEAASGDDDPDPSGGETTGETTGPAPVGGIGIPLLTLAPGIGSGHPGNSEYSQWLDGGTGQMGDLVAQ